MIYELRTYTVRAGLLPDMVAASARMYREIRRDDHGTLVGFWSSEIGTLNQIVHLWSFADQNERISLRARLTSNPRLKNEYIPVVAPLVVKQEIRVVDPVLAPIGPSTSGNIYELRTYRCKNGGSAKQWIDLFSAAASDRARTPEFVGLWRTETPQPNEVCQIWAYRDFEHRMAVRQAMDADADWRELRRRSADLVEEQQATLMLPSAHSPMR